LRKRLDLSLRSFAASREDWTPDAEEKLFFFVLEDTSTGAVVGTTAIKSGIGLGEPFYSYRVSTVVHASRELGVYKAIPTLYLNNDYTGSMEVGSLYLAPEARHGGNGKLLSKCRFLFLAEDPNRFPDKVVAEMRGVSDQQGNSPFWEGVGRHFFSMEFHRADFLTGTRGKTFIAELMPRNPIYVPLLPPAAQEVIGRVHDHTRPALRLLEEEGFHYEGYVDIFDGGATVEARTAEVRAVRESRIFEVTASPSSGGSGLASLLVSNGRWDGFRCCLAEGSFDGERLHLRPEVLEALEVTLGDSVRAVSLRPQPVD
jgi:arginine N-succinyltransferase